jgi:DNA repair protein RadC
MHEESITKMTHAEKPKTRIKQVGVEAMKDSELLAVLLGLRSIKQAEELLTQTPLVELLNGRESLARLRGLSEARAAVILASAELHRRAAPDRVGDVGVIRSMNDIIGQSVELRNLKKEHLLAFFLNARQQLIAKETISIGTLTASLAHPREIFTPAIGKAAASVILVHNHPSGDPSPSDEDIRLTKRIVQAGQIMGIDLMDHLIVAKEGCYSFKQAGAL